MAKGFFGIHDKTGHAKGCSFRGDTSTYPVEEFFENLLDKYIADKLPPQPGLPHHILHKSIVVGTVLPWCKWSSPAAAMVR